MEKVLLLNDKNLSTMKEEVIKGYQLLREEVIIRLFTTYGAVDLQYDDLDSAVSDYAKIRGGYNNEKW